jgi:hypothetical protein
MRPPDPPCEPMLGRAMPADAVSGSTIPEASQAEVLLRDGTGLVPGDWAAQGPARALVHGDPLVCQPRDRGPGRLAHPRQALPVQAEPGLIAAVVPVDRRQPLTRLRHLWTTGSSGHTILPSLSALGNPVGEGTGDRGCAAGDLQPFVDVFQVGAHRSLGDAEPSGDLGVGVPGGQQVQ